MESENSYLNTQHQLLLTLKKQIEAMNPIKLSYQNLRRYHSKITLDLQQLINEHDHTVCTLSKNNEVYCHLGIKTDEQRTTLLNLLRQKQNQLAKLILDNKNASQRHQSLTNKLKLEQNLIQQNTSHQKQLEAIFKNLKTQIEILTKTNVQGCQTNSEMLKQNRFLCEQIQTQKRRRQNFFETNQNLKNQIAKINDNNDCLAKQNRSLEEHIALNEKEIQLKIKLNRQLKQADIELTQTHQNIRNQKQYQMSILNMEQDSTRQLQIMLSKLQTFLAQTQTQKNQANQENIHILKLKQDQILKLKQNQAFVSSSQSHLGQLKEANEVLLKKMEDYCLQDLQVQNILMKKAQILKSCYRKMNMTGIFNQKGANMIVGTTLKKQASFKGSIIQKVTNLSSGKNWSSKQNYSDWKLQKQTR